MTEASAVMHGLERDWPDIRFRQCRTGKPQGNAGRWRAHQVRGRRLAIRAVTAMVVRREAGAPVDVTSQGRDDASRISLATGTPSLVHWPARGLIRESRWHQLPMAAWGEADAVLGQAGDRTDIQPVRGHRRKRSRPRSPERVEQ